MYKKMMLNISLIFFSGVINASEGSDWWEGAKASVCAALPTGACEFMSKENNKNMVKAITAFKLHSVCGSINIEFIERQINDNSATEECEALYNKFKKEGLL